MPAQVTDYGAQQWAAMLFGIISVPASYWVGLASSEPGTGIDGTMLEDLEPLTSAGYARVQVLADNTHWGLTANGYISNLQVIRFPVASADWGYLSHAAICSASTAGELYGYGEFVNPQSIGIGYLNELPVGSVAIKLVSLSPSIVT